MITLCDSKKPGSLICQFMDLVDNFIAEKTEFKTMGYREQETDSKKVIQVSVFIAEKDYEEDDDNYAYLRGLDH